MMKNYLLNLLQQCSEEQFGQDAVEWAIVSGRVRLSYDLERDLREIMPRYDEIIEAYRHSLTAAADAPANSRAPMERAVPGRREKVAVSDSSARKRRAA